MIETITAAGCGGRRRQKLALALFTLAAIASSAAVGATFGAVGVLAGREAAGIVAIAVVVLVVLREAGGLRVPLPQLRRQVPERWRRELPVAAWSPLYGAGLGAGFATYQPTSLLWAAVALATTLASPLLAGLCLAAFGAGRALAVVLAGLSDRDPADSAHVIADRPWLARRLAASAGVTVAVLALAAAAGAAQSIPLGPGSQLDPSSSGGGVLAFTQRDGDASSVVVRRADRSRVVVADAAAPSLRGELLAYADADGIAIVEWSTSKLLARVNGRLEAPALDWPWLAYVSVGPHRRSLVLRNMTTGSRRVVASTTRGNALTRPSLRGGLLVWTVSDARHSEIAELAIRHGSAHVIAHSATIVYSNAALGAGVVVWVEQDATGSSLWAATPNGQRRQRVLQAAPGARLWTTAVVGKTAYVTVWRLARGPSAIVRVRF